MSDDLTRLTDEEREALRHAIYNPGFHIRGDSEHHWVAISAAVESILAARLDELEHEVEGLAWRNQQLRERLERTRDSRSKLAALRAAVTGLADEWEAKHHTSPSRARGSGPTMTFAGAANQLRALLADEGRDD